MSITLKKLLEGNCSRQAMLSMYKAHSFSQKTTDPILQIWLTWLKSKQVLKLWIGAAQSTFTKDSWQLRWPVLRAEFQWNFIRKTVEEIGTCPGSQETHIQLCLSACKLSERCCNNIDTDPEAIGFEPKYRGFA